MESNESEVVAQVSNEQNKSSKTVRKRSRKEPSTPSTAQRRKSSKPRRNRNLSGGLNCTERGKGCESTIQRDTSHLPPPGAHVHVPMTKEQTKMVFNAVPEPWALNSLYVDAEIGMEECIRRQRKLVKKLPSYLPLLDMCIQSLTNELRTVDEVLQSRKKALETALDKAVRARDDIINKVHEKRFEDTVKKYVVAHAARVEEEDLLRGAAKRRHILPTIGTGYALLDSDCSRETRPPVTVEEKIIRMVKQGTFAGRGRGSLLAATAAASAIAHEGKIAGSACQQTSVRRGITTIAGSNRAVGGVLKSQMMSAPASGLCPVTNELSAGVVSEMLVALGIKRPAVDIVLPDHCPLCKVPMVKGIGEQVLVCPTCHLTKTFLDSTAASMAFGEDSVEFNMFQYRRINHFNDALNELQGKEKANITQAQLQRIMEQMFESFGPVAKENITYAMVRHIIRDKLRMVKCYKHIVLITSLLSGRPSVQMSPRQETLARLIFELMQEPFERAPFRERHNFLSYPVTLFKICQMLGLVEFFPMLPLLRGEDKLKQQEELFQWICSYRGWKPPPSVLSNAASSEDVDIV